MCYYYRKFIFQGEGMMKYFVGLDVSLKETAICVVNLEGDIIHEGSAFSDPKDLSDYLLSLDLTFDKIGLEAGTLTPWLYHEMLANGLSVICIETRHAKAALKAQSIKTDKNDARGLAHIMRTGWYKSVHIKSDESQRLRVLLNNRRFLIAKRRDLENQIRGTLKIFGFKIGKISVKEYENRIYSLLHEDIALFDSVRPLLQIRMDVLDKISYYDEILSNHVKNDPICQRFMTIPGVGPLTSLSFKAAIDRPERFRHSRDVGAHLGLTPRKYASGEIDYNGKITKCGDTIVRSHLFEAAKVMLSRTKQWSKLKAWGIKLAQRSTMKNACIAVARKLSVIMHRMWIDETNFIFSNETLTTSPL